jgi:hypothetical protein
MRDVFDFHLHHSLWSTSLCIQKTQDNPGNYKNTLDIVQIVKQLYRWSNQQKSQQIDKPMPLKILHMRISLTFENKLCAYKPTDLVALCNIMSNELK